MSKLLATALFGALVVGVAALDNQKKGDIKALNGTTPYGIEKRRVPSGLNLDQLLPTNVGPYTRTLLEKSEQRGVTPTSIDDSVYATYRAGSKEIFVEFAVAANAENAQAILVTAAGDTTGRFPTDLRVASIRTEPS